MTIENSRNIVLGSFLVAILAFVPIAQSVSPNLNILAPQMASASGSIVLNNATTTDTANSSPYKVTLPSFNVGTSSNRLLVVGVEANNEYVSSVTFGGTQLTKAVSSFTNNDAEFWYLKNPSGTGDIVVTMNGATSVVVGAYAFSGVDQTTPIPTTATNHNTANSSPTISITTANANSWVLDSPAIYGGKTLSSPTCTTQRWDINVASAITGASSSKTQTLPGSVTCSWTASGSGDLWDDIAVEIKAATLSTIALSNTATTNTANSSPYKVTLPSFNVGTSSNRLLVVGVEADSEYVSAVTFGGVSLTKAVSHFINNDAEFWYLKNPSGTGDIVVTMNGATSVVVGAYAFSGVDQTTPIPTTAGANNTHNSSPTISITTANANSWVLDSPAIYGGKTLSSPTCTQQWDTNVASAITGASSSTITTTPGSVTCSWTASGSGDLWDDVAIEIKAATAATVPNSPTGLNATQVSSQINLFWAAPANNGGSAITGYKIEKSTDGGNSWSTLVANTGSTSTRYSDTNLAAGTTFTYRVSAINSVGTSSPSNTASATTLPSSYWTAKTGLLIPLYTDPQVAGNGWSQVKTIKTSHTTLPVYLIANFGNPGGPDPTCNTNHTNTIVNEQAKGVIVLGYVFTHFGDRNSTLVDADIAQWKNCVPTINGTFFDEMNYPGSGHNIGTVNYYQDATRYAKSLGMKYTVGNPGSPTDSTYIGSVDILNTFEQNHAPTTQNLTDATISGVDKHNFSFLSYAVSNSTFGSQPISTDSGYVGLMYFTDDSGSNPWNQISTYLSTEATDLDK